MGGWRALLSLLILGVYLLASPIPGTGLAYQPPVLDPGGIYTCTIGVHNDSVERRRAVLHARLRGHRFWGSPSQTAIVGSWVALDPVVLPGLEGAEIECLLPVPDPAPPVLQVELRGTGSGIGASADRWSFPMVERAAILQGRGSHGVPFRIVAGGPSAYDEDGDYPGEVHSEVVRTDGEWTSLRARFGIIPPDSWGLPVQEQDARNRPALFASPAVPDLAAETLLVLRSRDHCESVRPLRLWVRSVEEEPEGSLLCRFTYRERRVRARGPVFGYCDSGSWLLVAIPRTDAPIGFRRVP